MFTDPRAEKILRFWFASVENALPNQERMRFWFGGDASTDLEIKTHFKEDLDNAIKNNYADWESSARSSLALIILFDQFTRNIYRNAATAFAYDQKALDLCLQGIERGYDHNLSLIERVFFYMPFMHAENLKMQEISTRAFQSLYDISFPEAQPTFKVFYEFAVRHYEVIKKFHRFPHRNIILGRLSTQEEKEFLETHPMGF